MRYKIFFCAQMAICNLYKPHHNISLQFTSLAPKYLTYLQSDAVWVSRKDRKSKTLEQGHTQTQDNTLTILREIDSIELFHPADTYFYSNTRSAGEYA